MVFFSDCDHRRHQHLSAGHWKTSHMSDTSYFIDLYTNWTLKDSIIKLNDRKLALKSEKRGDNFFKAHPSIIVLNIKFINFDPVF